LGRTYGIDEASSAIDAAIHMTNMHGMNHPQTMAKWPPEEIVSRGFHISSSLTRKQRIGISGRDST